MSPDEVEPCEVEVHHSALQPGLDVRRLNQLIDELDSDAQLTHLATS